MDDLTQQFIDLCQQAYELDLATLNVTEVEPILVALLHLVKRHPEQRPLFVELFSLVADGEIQAPEYLLPFCMRELRFPEIRAKVQAELNGDRHTPRFARRMNFWWHVIHAFDDAMWEDAVFWPYYAHELKR